MGKGRAGRQDAHAGHTFKAKQSLETDMLDAPANLSFASRFHSLLAFAAAKIVLAIPGCSHSSTCPPSARSSVSTPAEAAAAAAAAAAAVVMMLMMLVLPPPPMQRPQHLVSGS